MAAVRFTCFAAALALVSVVAAHTLKDDYDTLAVPQPPMSNSGIVVTQFPYAFKRETVHVTVARVPNPLPYFQVFPGVGSGGDPFKCARANTSVTARTNGCQFATNAGFFDPPTGACLGNVVSENQYLQIDQDYNHPTFGTTQSGEYLIGYMNASAVPTLRAAVSGVGWLVRHSASFINQSAAIEGEGVGFLTEIAPRTAIGFDESGSLLIVEIDGEEDIKSGVTVIEFVEVLLSDQINAQSVINLDGGGSSAAYFNGKIIDKPTCIDTPKICERAVTTITCVLLNPSN